MTITKAFFLGTLFLIPGLASPIAGGPCGTDGTAAEFIALADIGCNLARPGARLVGIHFLIPQPGGPIEIVPALTTFELIDTPQHTQLIVSHVPLEPTLLFLYLSGRPTFGSITETDKNGAIVQTLSFDDFVNYPGRINHQFNISSAQDPAAFPASEQPSLFANYTIDITSVAAPEPAAFIPMLLLGGIALARRRYGVRNSSSR